MRLDITTKRLRLRPFEHADAPTVAALAAEPDVARMTALMPHPYPPEAAEGWIMLHPHLRRRAINFPFAVTLSDGALIGSAGAFKRAAADADFEIGYWIGKPYWGRGYATEAVGALVDWAREALGARRLTAGYFVDNPASARVLEKCGFERTGATARLYSLARRASVDCVGMARSLDTAPGDGALDASAA